MRAETLDTLLTRLRAETGQSLSPALGVNTRDTLVYTLQRVQEELYLAHDWPILRHSEVVPLAQGQYQLAIPATLDARRVSNIHARRAGATQDGWGNGLAFYLNAGLLDPAEQEPADAPRIWWRYLDPANNAEFLVVSPAPNRALDVRITGLRPLLPLVNSSDRCTLDATLLVMAASVEILTAAKNPTAQQKQVRMQAYLRNLRGEGAPHAAVITVGGTGKPYGGPRRPWRF
jgi:hypothetical protein